MNPEYEEFKPLAGALLAASPGLQDPNFRETLVYLADHNEEGAFGLVMNRPLGKTLSEAITLPDLSEKLANVPVLYGGPVQPTHLVISQFSVGGAEEQLLCQLTSNLSEAAAFLEDERGWVQAYAGYSGWGEGQLDTEIKANGWLHVAAAEELVFGTDMDSKWERAMAKLAIDPRMLSDNAGHA